jgi:hypothetical protein
MYWSRPKSSKKTKRIFPNPGIEPDGLLVIDERRRYDGTNPALPGASFYTIAAKYESGLS